MFESIRTYTPEIFAIITIFVFSSLSIPEHGKFLSLNFMAQIAEDVVLITESETLKIPLWSDKFSL